jgi:hypothetical protein
VTLSAHLTRFSKVLVLGAVAAGTVAATATARPVDVSDGATATTQAYLGSPPDVRDAASASSVAAPDVIERFAAAHPYGAGLSVNGSTEPLRPPDVRDAAASLNGPTRLGLEADGLRLQSMAQTYASPSSQPVRPPDIRDVADSVRAFPLNPSSPGFQWGDYAIGLGSGMGLVLVLGGGLAVGRMQRHRMQTA